MSHARILILSSIVCAAIASVGGYAAGYSQAILHSVDGDATDLLRSGVRWTPCFEDLSRASIAISYKEWTKQMAAMGQPTDADVTTVPRGPNKGEWILPGCVAFETATGHVVYWRDREGTTPAFVPYAQN